MTIRLRTVLHLAVLASATSLSAASAQSVNVDVGLNSVFPIPSSSYGGAANQPGTWNGVSASAIGPVSLVGLSGSPTSVSVSFTGGYGDYEYENVLTVGDDDALMDDTEDLGGPGEFSTWTFQGLANGQYEVTTYAWASDSDSYRTQVVVNGSADPAQIVGGGWPGTQALGVTYALHHVAVSSGTITIVATTANSPANGFGSVNGFQIKAVGSPITPFCFGDGTGSACPCGNSGSSGRGCQNSVGTGGARLVGSGSPTLASDTLVFSVSSELNSALTIFLQGDVNHSPLVFGDGLRCAHGNLKRLYTKTASSGAASAPVSGDPSVSSRSAAKGDTIAPGATRYYHAFYRDPNPTFCPPPSGSTFNSSNGLIVNWN